MATPPSFAGLVLAAGRGSRFPNEPGQPLPKVLRPVLGRPMIAYVLDALANAGIDDITLVVGFGADEVRGAVGSSVNYVLQAEQKGSGHAVLCAKDAFSGFDGALVIMCGDSPLFTAGTVRELMEEHARSGAVITLVSAVLEDPFGYGRIVRDSKGTIREVAEEACANETKRAIKEANGGLYCSNAQWLAEMIGNMTENSAHEFNLTDMVRVAAEQSETVSAVQCSPREMLGVNTPEQLAAVEEILRGR